MQIIRLIAAILVSTLVGTNIVASDIQAGPRLGKSVSQDEIKKWEIGIMPDGEGLPAGSGTAEDGLEVYQQHCLSCHGKAGSGGSADELAGSGYSLTGDYPEKTVGTYWPYATTLFDFNRRSMPMHAPGTLSNAQVYAVTAYVLYLNGIIKAKEVINAETLPKVKMPNRDGFINIYQDARSK